MRIIAGELRGRTISAPKGEGTRPTTDRVRESIMSIVNSARDGFEDAVVLDAFAGSGALGLEALSRGASCAYFYESNNEAYRVLSANVKSLGFEVQQARVRKSDVLKDIPTYVNPAIDLVFLDPPYAYNPQDILNLLASLHEREALCDSAVIVYEHGRTTNREVDEALEGFAFDLVQRKKYGDTSVDILSVSSTDETA